MDAARPVQGRHRSKSSFSFKSNKSDKSDPTRPRPELSDLTESPKERQKSKFALQTSRDPNKAIREAQPGKLHLSFFLFNVKTPILECNG